MKTFRIKLILLIFCTILLLCGCEKESPYIFDIPDFNITDSEPAWGPCGEWIAFSHGDTVPGKSGIYKISPDGEEIHQLHGGGQAPAWSPCGQWIAFSQGAQIWKKKINGDSLIQLTFEGRNFHPAWSPDGNYIAYQQSVCGDIQCGLWLINLNDTTCYLIALYGVFPDFHPEKKTILYRRRWVEDSQVLGDKMFTYNYMTDETTFIISLQEPNHDNRYLRINSDGKKIVFSSKPRTGKRQIWTMNIDGTDRKQLTHTQAYSCDWSPCGKYIVYTDSRRENGRLWIMDADGSNKRQLTFEHHF